MCGILADEMIELMCARLVDMQFEHELLDVSRPDRFALTWQVCRGGATGRVVVNGRSVNLADVTGVYARYVSSRGGRSLPGVSARERELIDAEGHIALMQLLDRLPCRVVNRPSASTSNDSKLYQQSVIGSHGFATPKTLATTDADEALAFYESCGRRVIAKSLSGVRSVVRELREEDLSRLQLLLNCPTQFQEYVSGVDIRVHTVGDRVFATEMRSQASDYRYSAQMGCSLHACAVKLPAPVAAACVHLARTFGLSVAGIDLRRTPAGQYYCFEVNPSPAFIFFERLSGQAVSVAVAEFLRGEVGARKKEMRTTKVTIADS